MFVYSLYYKFLQCHTAFNTLYHFQAGIPKANLAWLNHSYTYILHIISPALFSVFDFIHQHSYFNFRWIGGWMDRFLAWFVSFEISTQLKNEWEVFRSIYYKMLSTMLSKHQMSNCLLGECLKPLLWLFFAVYSMDLLLCNTLKKMD